MRVYLGDVQVEETTGTKAKSQSRFGWILFIVMAVRDIVRYKGKHRIKRKRLHRR